MTFDYECSKCGNIQEEWHGMKERPLVHCLLCRGACIKLIGTGGEIMGLAGGRGLYDFVDYKTTTKPIKFNTKRQWKEHLKRINHIEVENIPPTADQIASKERTKRMVAKRELKEAVVAAVKDKKHIKEMKQKILSKRG